MVKEISGYVRDRFTGNPAVGAAVVVKDAASGVAIPTGGSYVASTNPMAADGDGFFRWFCDFNPGLLSVEAANGDEVRIRTGNELMQKGEMFDSDLSLMLQSFTSGIIVDLYDEFEVFEVSGQRRIRLSTGVANMLGRLISMSQGDLEADLDANPSLVVRHDLVVLQQHIGGSTPGRQGWRIVKGVTSATDPLYNQDPNIFELALARAKIPQNATSIAKPDDLRVGSGPASIGSNTVTLDSLTDEVLDAFDAGGYKDKKDTNFAAQTTNLTSGSAVRTLGSAQLTNVPAGTYLIECAINCSMYAVPNSGYARFKLTGNAAPVTPDDSNRAFWASGNVIRQVVLSSRLKVTPTVPTTYTVNATVQYETGDPTRILDGVVYMTIK